MVSSFTKNKLLSLAIVVLLVSSCSLADDFIKTGKPKVTKSKVGLTGFEAQAEQKICAQKTCVTAVYTASTSNLLSFVIVGNENIENFLMQNGINSNELVGTMNFLEVVKESNGNIRNLRFLVPKNETNDNDSQIKKVCNNIRVECSVDVIVPDEKTNINKLIDAGCIFVNTIIAIPDIGDLACAIYVLS